jgi:dTDP-4-dehydrorhamnose reductase
VRVLVTGASGLLGVNLALEAAKEHTVFGLVNRQHLKTDAFSVVQADLLAPGAVEKLLDSIHPDWVIHCAALANVDACEADPDQANQVNTELPKKLAQNVARSGARLLHVSTDAVFDGRSGSYTESDAPNPLGVYAMTKLAGEHLVAEADPGAIIARVNLFGWSISGQRSLAEFFYSNLRAGNSVNGFKDVYFCPLLANHLAQIMLKMLYAGLSGLYHVVSSDCTSKYDFGIRIARRFSFDESLINSTSVSFANLSAKRSRNLTLNSGRLALALNFTPPEISAGVDQFYSLYRQGYPDSLRRMSANFTRNTT